MNRGLLACLIVTALTINLLPTGTSSAKAESGTIVADSLANPRGIAIADDGTLYVAEAGLSGSEQFTPSPYPLSTRGTSGQVTKIAPGGAKSVVASGIPSLSLGGNGNAFVLGPGGLILANGALWLAVGAMPAGIAIPANAAAVLRIDPQSGMTTKVADLAAFERANNPDTFEITSDPYGVLLANDGNLYVADAGANDLVRVNPQTGRASLVAVFAGIPAPDANVARAGAKEVDPVPTYVVQGPDGNLYVGLLTGFPTQTGAAKVLRVSPNGAVSDAVTGLTGVSGVAFGPDRQMYVTEFGFEAGKGRILRVLADGTKQVVMDGLTTPNGTAFDKAGNMYVSVNSSTAPNDGAQGQILRFDGVATAATPAPPSAGTPSAPQTGGGAGAAFIRRLGDGYGSPSPQSCSV
jgi:sugar lactone lactonase YvrE